MAIWILRKVRVNTNAYPNTVPLLLASPLVIHETSWKCLDVQAQGFSVALKDYIHQPNVF